MQATMGALEHDFYPNTHATLGNRLRLLRLLMGLTQADLAEETGLSRSYISMLENGSRHLTLVSATYLAPSLGVLVEDLLGSSIAEEVGLDLVLRHFGLSQRRWEPDPQARQAQRTSPKPPCYSPVCRACEHCVRNGPPRGGVAESGLLRWS